MLASLYVFSYRFCSSNRSTLGPETMVRSAMASCSSSRKRPKTGPTPPKCPWSSCASWAALVSASRSSFPRRFQRFEAQNIVFEP